MKRISAVLLPLLISLTIPTIAFAQPVAIGSVCDNTGKGTSFGGLCIDAAHLGPLINNVVNLLFLVAAIIALVYLVLGGIKWITSEGDSKNVEAARNQIIAASIGLAVTFLSYLIIGVLLSFFGISGGLSGLKLPTITGS